MATNTNDKKYHQRKLDWIKRNPDKVRYNSQKQKAKKRGIIWNLSFEEWSKLWQESGHYHEMGRTADEYQMCRYGDTGAYEIDNVYIDTCRNNRASQIHPRLAHPEKWKRI